MVGLNLVLSRIINFGRLTSVFLWKGEKLHLVALMNVSIALAVTGLHDIDEYIQAQLLLAVGIF